MAQAKGTPSPPPDAQLVREVSERIKDALARNRRLERFYLGGLCLLFVCGLTLSGWLVYAGQWAGAGGGAVVFGGIATWPVRKLIQLRRSDLALEVFPELLKLSDGRGAKVMLQQLATELMKWVR